MHSKYNVLRGVMAIIVLIAHINQVFWIRLYGTDSIILKIIGTMARHAVLIFFLLSGYLITLSIINNIQINKKFNYIDYFISRFIRIYPPFIGSLIVTVVIWGIIHYFNLAGKYNYGLPMDLYVVREKYDLTVKSIVEALMLQKENITKSNGPLWSLFIEIKIYFLVAIVMIFATKKTIKIRVLTLITIVCSAFAFGQEKYFLFFSFVWMIGSLAAIFRDIFKKHLSIFYVLFLIILLLIIIVKNHASILILDTNLPNLFMQIGCSIIYAYFIFYSSCLDRIYPQYLIATGNYSYSLYLIHFPLLLLGLSLTQNWIVYSYSKTTFVSVIMGVSIITLSWLFSSYFENKYYFKWRSKKHSSN
jgi:peptidoglycan/LPS O-acetylase OafA/YrhL